MDIEFHYYVTHLIASRAEFDEDSAQIIAYSTQYVDNNDIVFEINPHSSSKSYKNYISQTLDITKPQEKLK